MKRILQIVLKGLRVFLNDVILFIFVMPMLTAASFVSAGLGTLSSLLVIYVWIQHTGRIFDSNPGINFSAFAAETGFYYIVAIGLGGLVSLYLLYQGPRLLDRVYYPSKLKKVQN